MREFASVLPDYHKPDILTLIISYMPPPPAAIGPAGERVEGSREVSLLRPLQEKER